MKDYLPGAFGKFVRISIAYLRALPPCLHPMQRYLNALQKYNFFSELPNFIVKNLYIAICGL
ncbi:MAG: hypothetical protein IKW98_08815 [Prevotella sp.]|nr:hypothetical protein [Prevotella sp.]